MEYTCLPVGGTVWHTIIAKAKAGSVPCGMRCCRSFCCMLSDRRRALRRSVGRHCRMCCSSSSFSFFARYADPIRYARSVYALLDSKNRFSSASASRTGTFFASAACERTNDRANRHAMRCDAMP